MIQEDYVSFETAKLLKEKSFDESCKQIYDGEGYLLPNNCGYINEESPNEYFHALAPTLQIAMKWLRLQHHLHVLLNIIDMTQVDPKYYCVILDTTKHETYTTDLFNSYEQACEEGIIYCLKNLI